MDNAFGILLFIQTELFENQFYNLHQVIIWNYTDGTIRWSSSRSPDQGTKYVCSYFHLMTKTKPVLK